jgi:3',5'-cyclic AMP phosphodiesterase CpdA
MVDTIILRFRDLVTSHGGTISNHQKIATEHGYVWWGWWRKSGETVPDDAFRALAAKAQGGTGLLVYLFDSGRSLLFTATCKEIRWQASREAFVSPEPALTPDYYRDTPYVAWFKLTDIQPAVGAATNHLHRFSYERIDAFFENGQSRYGRFYDKRLFDLEELRQQDRSIWFLRTFRENDAVHKIELLNSKSLTPCDFDGDFNASKSANLLWLSDIHFSVDNHHAFPSTTSQAVKDLGQAIEDSLREHHVTDIAGVIMSGDLTWKADPAEFASAEALIDRLGRSPSTIDHYRFAVCPGNHDVKFTDEPWDKSKKFHDAVAPETSRAAWSEFYKKIYFKKPNEYLSSGRRLLLGGAIPVEIVCLNSSLLEQKENWFQGHGFVGDAQLDHAARSLGWTEPTDDRPRPFRILVMHHHLMPVIYRENPVGGAASSVVFDAEAVVRWVLKYRVNIVLHGHMHAPFVARVSRPLNGIPTSNRWHTFHVFGLGSSGVASAHRGDEKNMFGLLSFSGKSVTVKVLSVHKQDPSVLVWEASVPLLPEAG